MIFTSDPKNGRFQLGLAKLRTILGLAPDYKFTPEEMADIQWAKLQLESPVSTKGTVKFQTQKGNNNTDLPDALLLDKNDIFIATGKLLCIRRYSATGKYSTEPLFTYPASKYFDGTLSGKVNEWQAILAYFHGTHTLKVGGKNIQDTISNVDLLKVPNAPYTATNPELAEFDFDKLVTGLVSPIALFGANNYELILQAGTAADWDIADGSYNASGATRTTRNEFVWFFEGIKVIGGSNPSLKIDRW